MNITFQRSAHTWHILKCNISSQPISVTQNGIKCRLVLFQERAKLERKIELNKFLMRMTYRKKHAQETFFSWKKSELREIFPLVRIRRTVGNGITIWRRNVALTIISDYELLTFRSKINTYLKERWKRLDTVKAIS